MPRLNLIDIINNPDVDRILDPFAFEKYCSSCDNFPYNNNPHSLHECPYPNQITYDTEWELLGCAYYMN